MNRRDFVRALALAPVAGAIGCTAAGNASNVDPTRIADDVANIIAGLTALAVAPQVQATLSPGALTILANALSEAEAIAAQVAAPSTGVPLPTAQAWVQTLANDVSSILSLINAVPGLPPQVTLIVTAIQTLLPLVEVAVSLASTASVGVTPMTPTQARQILQNLR